MDIPIEAIFIIVFGGAVAIFWYVSQVRMLWNSVQIFKKTKEAMLVGKSPEEIKKILSEILKAEGKTGKKTSKEKDHDQLKNMYQ